MIVPRSRLLVVFFVCLVTAAVVPAAGLAETSKQAQYGGVPGPNAPLSSEPPTQASAQASSQTLPFTGGDLLLMLLAGTGLAGLGLVLRTTTRRERTGR